MKKSQNISRSRGTFEKLPLNWFTATSIESLYASLLKPGVDVSNPSLISFIKAEGLPELVCCSHDGIASYVDQYMRHFSPYCYSTELSEFVQRRNIKIKKLWIIATDHHFDLLVHQFSNFISCCPIQSICIDLIPCGVAQDYCEAVNAVLYKIDRVLGSFYNDNAEHLGYELDLSISSQYPEFRLPLTNSTRSGLKLNVVDSQFAASENINMLSPMSDVESPVLSRSLSDYHHHTPVPLQSETDDSYEASLMSKDSGSQLLPTPLTSPSINIKQDPFETTQPITNIWESNTASLFDDYIAPIVKIDTIRLQTIASHLLASILLLERRWKIKYVEVETQNSFQELEDAIECNSELITTLRSNMYLPFIIVKFRDSNTFNSSLFNFTSNDFSKRVSHIRDIYPSMSFFCGLGFDDFTNLQAPNKVETIIKLIKPSDIRFIRQDSRIPADKDQENIREWRKLIALFENLEQVTYIANLSESGTILSNSWSKLNWFWKSYNKLEEMTFDFTCTKDSLLKKDSRIQIIEIPSGVKILTLNLDLASKSLKILDLSKIIKMKNTNLSQLTINVKNHSYQNNITLVIDGVTSSVQTLELNACQYNLDYTFNVTIKAPTLNNFNKITQNNCEFCQSV